MGQRLRTGQSDEYVRQKPERDAPRSRTVVSELGYRAGLPVLEVCEPRYEYLGNKELPVHKEKQHIQEMIREFQISMVEGPTGSGKSTQIGQYALEAQETLEGGYKKIIYLEPRVHLADNLTDRLIAELDSQLGEREGDRLVGARHSERSTGFGKRIEIMTPDTFLKVYSELEQYDNEPVLIVGDEIHEKDFSTELAVAVVVEALSTHPQWRLVLCSATLDADSIQQAYGDMYGKEVPRVSVEGRPYNLEMIEEPDLTPEEAYEKYGGDYLKTQMFVAGKQEIRDTTDTLRSMQLGRMRITPFHARLSRAAIYAATRAQLEPGERQIIPSTNAAQSGITIPGLRLVISDGTNRRPDIDDKNVEGLFKTECARDELIQQAGRAARDVDDGLFILTKPADENFSFRSIELREAHAPAQIYHTNIAGKVLSVAALERNFHNLNQLLIHKANPERVTRAYESLYRLGALDEQNYVTDIGKKMNRFPLRPEFSRAIVEAMQRESDSEAIYQLVGMVSAVGAGGLPNFERNSKALWRKDVQAGTNDDYTAQLDMLIATRRFYDGKDVNEKALESRNYDLKNTKRAHTTYDKCCRALGLSSTHMPKAPTKEQLVNLYDYLAAGLFDSAYRRLPPDGSNSEATYVSIFATDEAPQRRGMTDRRVYKGEDPYVLGSARRFEKHVKGYLEEFSVIENVLPTTIELLAKHARWLAEHIEQPVTVHNGLLQQHNRLNLGSVNIGDEQVKTGLHHTAETRRVLQNAAFEKPQEALKELISIKRDVEHLTRLIPDNEIASYFPNGILTDEWLKQQVAHAIVDDVDNTYMLDINLRSMIVSQGVSLETWIPSDKILEITSRSPEWVQLGSEGKEYQVYYSHGKPIVNGFSVHDFTFLTDDDWKLPDGRVILINYADDGHPKKYSSGELKQLLAANAK